VSLLLCVIYLDVSYIEILQNTGRGDKFQRDILNGKVGGSIPDEVSF
jgi:hypothetical protein